MMFNALLEAEMQYSERLSLAGEVVVIGLGTVFCVLAILMLALYIFQLFTYTLPKKRAAKKAAAAAEPVPEAETASAEAETSDDALIAVIAAAVAAYETDENGRVLPFRVVSLRRKTGRTSWDGNTGIE